MRVSINESLCDGHGVCVDSCPEVFALGYDDDTVTLLTAEPAESLWQSVDQAASRCPTAAIKLDA